MKARDIVTIILAVLLGVGAMVATFTLEMKSNLKAEIGSSSSDLKADIRSSSSDLKAEIRSSSSDLKADIRSSSSDLKADIRSSSSDLKADIKDIGKNVSNLQDRMVNVENSAKNLTASMSGKFPQIIKMNEETKPTSIE